MADNAKKAYKSYKLSNSFESFNSLPHDPLNLDRHYMAQFLSPIIHYLYVNGILHYQDFAQLFKKYKLKSKEITKFIKYFESFINSQTSQKRISWLRDRELIKSNFSEKNIIFNRLVHEYHDEILRYLSYFFTTYYPNMYNFQMFKDEFEKKAEEVFKQSDLAKTTEISNNSNDPEPSENKITETKEISDKIICVTQKYVKKIIIIK
ncbi:hypothetical protein M9Y10_006248 [Tritrichomonas musculus]|uniref:LisH domain-containing protein n=1 Tax=Tritrichomonas musculus TaxID=1915356 RepID=A0ABR2JDR3_9EUKA